MGKADDLRKRLDAIKATLAGSLLDRLATLSPSQRAEYDHWRERCTAFYADRPGDAAYNRMINHGEVPPPLRRDIREILYGPTLTIPATATNDEAAEIYRRCASGEKRAPSPS